MSNSHGWSVVSKKNKTRKANGRHGGRNAPIGKNNVKAATGVTAINHAESDKEINYTEADKELCKRKIRSLLEKLRHTDFFGNLMHVLKDNSVKDIVCYGVGNFAEGAAPMWQFACILCLREFLPVDNVYYYDPCTTKLELELLADFDIQVISENERGLRQVSVPTFFYMPHCAQFLYNNVLVSNWKSLDMVVIFGNSLQAYQGRQGRTLLKAIEVLLPFLEEKPLDYSKRDLQEHFQLEYAFNDCRLVRVEMASDIELPTMPPVETHQIEDDLEVI
jgi:hypothetical protein